MKVGDLVRLKEDSFSSLGFNEVFHDAVMIVAKILTIAGPEGFEITPVVEVVGPVGLSRFNKEDVEVLPEVIEDEIQYMSAGFVD